MQSKCVGSNCCYVSAALPEQNYMKHICMNSRTQCCAAQLDVAVAEALRRSAELSAPLGPAMPLEVCPGSRSSGALSEVLLCAAATAADSFESWSSMSSSSTSSAAQKGNPSANHKGVKSYCLTCKPTHGSPRASLTLF